MKKEWLRGFPRDEHETRKQELLRYRPAFEELKRVLRTYQQPKACVRDYGDPNWAYRQIAVNEYNQALQDLIELITLEKED
jgi:hypothetical protein